MGRLAMPSFLFSCFMMILVLMTLLPHSNGFNTKSAKLSKASSRDRDRDLDDPIIDQDEEDIDLQNLQHQQQQGESGVFSYNMEHSLNGGEFSLRGRVELHFTSTNRPGTVKFSDAAEGVDLPSLFSRHDQSFNGWYRVRFTPDSNNPNYYSNNNNSIVSPVAAVKSCALALSGFREAFVFHSDVYGHVTSVDYRTPLTQCDSSSPSSSLLSSSSSFAPKARISLGKMAEKPKAAAVSAAAPAPGSEEEKKAEQSFFSKYWMYIVPFGIIMLLQAAAGAQEQGGQGGGSGSTQ